MAIQREYLSPNEIAEYLGVSPFTIRRYIKLGELKAVKLLGGFRVHRSDLQSFLKAHEVNPAEEQLEPEEIGDAGNHRDAAQPAAASPARTVPAANTPAPPRLIPIPDSSPVRRRGRPRKQESAQ